MPAPPERPPPLHNEGEEISALDNDVDKWLQGGLDDGSMRYSETWRLSILWEPLQVNFLVQKLWYTDVKRR